MNNYKGNSRGVVYQLGQAQNQDLAVTDALMIAKYGDLPITDPGGGRPTSVGKVWVERTGDAGWMPLVYTSSTGRPPPSSDAPSTLSMLTSNVPGWAWFAAAAAGAYYLSRFL